MPVASIARDPRRVEESMPLAGRKKRLRHFPRAEWQVLIPNRSVAGPSAHIAGATGNELQLYARHGQNDRVIAIGRKICLFAGSNAEAAVPSHSTH